MSEITKIQWCDTTVNPIMGCGGCELFPKPATVLASISKAMNKAGASPQVTKATVENMFQQLIDVCILKLEEDGQRQPDHSDQVTTTNISQLKDRFFGDVEALHGKPVAEAANAAIRQSITCYAYVLHNLRGLSILNGNRKGHKGHSPVFEKLTPYEGRMTDTAALDDLLGTKHPATDWKQRLPRMIFVSDMGDALTERKDFDFLADEVMPAIGSENGRRHLWLWLTKRPHLMVEFADKVGGFPDNVCAMTTLTGSDPGSMKRLANLKKVKASIKGLSIEPLWERIAPKDLDLSGIDWVIVGGESGSGNLTRPFDLAWAEELRDHCRKKKVAFFFKQAGTIPVRNGVRIRYEDDAGGDWTEWEPALRVREFPKAFHDYRAGEVVESLIPRPIPDDEDDLPLTEEDQSDFKRLDAVVRRGADAFMEAGEALIEIQERKLWRASGKKTWESYCRGVAGYSKSYALRLVQAVGIVHRIGQELPIGNSGEPLRPLSEFQIRPLGRLEEPEDVKKAWALATAKAGNNNPSYRHVEEAAFEVLPPQNKTKTTETARERRLRAIDSLKKAIRKQVEWKQLEKLVADLEKLA